MKELKNVSTWTGGGGSPEQSQRVVFGRQLNENYSQTSARQAKPRFRLQARAVAFNAKGGEPAEPVAERHPRLNPSDWTTKTPYCHPELADLRTDERSEIRIASRLNQLEQSSFGETLRAWSKYKTDSGSVRRHELPVSRARSRNKFGMTPAEPVLCLDRGLSVKKCAFTMAEILLSLTIIGVVAAITLPSLTGNINERTWNTQRKALYARFSQAIALMPALNGYGTLKEESSSGADDAVDTAAETFVTNGLSKVMKINNICDNEHLEDCGIPAKITPYSGDNINLSDIKTLLDYNSLFTSASSYNTLNTKAAAFETQNGESILVYYNPNCTPNKNEVQSHFVQSKMCVNFVYDLNGSKGPNTMGKDIGFITALYPSDPIVVAPMPHIKVGGVGWTYQTQGGARCTKQDPEYRMPSLDEMSSMFYNRLLTGSGDTNGYYWTSTATSSTNAWRFNYNIGKVDNVGKLGQNSAWCIKR